MPARAPFPLSVIAMVTDYDCWRPTRAELDKHELLKEIIANLQQATEHAIALIRAAVDRFDAIAAIPAPAHSALELAIWTDREHIPAAVKTRCGVLLEKYLAG